MTRLTEKIRGVVHLYDPVRAQDKTNLRIYCNNECKRTCDIKVKGFQKEPYCAGCDCVVNWFYLAMVKLAEYEETGIEPNDILTGIELAEIAIKLAEHKKYTETGLTPEECKTLSATAEINADIVEKLQRLKNDKKFIELPCSIGDTVYIVNEYHKTISSLRIISVMVRETGLFFDWTLIEGIYDNLQGFPEREISKSVFLSREEAEKVLEGKNNDRQATR